jgi:hypothetical protein
MKQVTIDLIALDAAREAEEIIAMKLLGGQPQRQARLQVMFARWIEHAVNRERRNDRRRLGRTRS